MYLRRSTALKYLLAVPLTVIFYCEWFVYIIQPLFWQKLECKEESKCVKLLFIADPQIQGEMAVSPPLSLLYNWDSDRYLRSTFSVVLWHFKPNVLVYLGDLTDEGSVATMEQFQGYVKRLLNIFNVYYPVVHIWLPGDNDIGGENEPVQEDKVNEFSNIFNQPSVLSFRNVITFYKVNSVMYKVPPAPGIPDLNVKVAVSHYPISSKGVYGRQVDAAIHADIYFSAHEHSSKYVKQKRNSEFKEIHLLKYNDPVLDVMLDDEWLYEVLVPTCSYRMGTSDVGYGAAVVENQQLQYTVFWSPKRFPHLFAYLYILPVILIISCGSCCICMVFRQRIFRKCDVPLLYRI